MAPRITSYNVCYTKLLRPGSEETVERKSDDSQPLAALAFKIMTDPFVGSLTFVRVYSGVLEGGTQVLNSVKEQKERVGRNNFV